MSLTAFVTGASGFVGSNLVRELHRQGWSVHALARSTSSLAEIEGVPCTLHTGDIVDAPSLAGAIPEGADAVFHVAASTNFWSKRNALQTRVNVEGTANMLEAARQAGAKRFIHTSSFVTWGFPRGLFTEESPRSEAMDWINYFRTKHLAEQHVLECASQGRMEAVVLNPANILGPGDHHNWARLIRTLHEGRLPAAPPGGGNFCDVREVAKAHIRACSDGRNGQRYILGGEFATFREVIDMAGAMLERKVPSLTLPAWLFRAMGRVMPPLESLLGREPLITPESAGMTSRVVHCDSGRAIRELGYQAVPVRDMLQDTIAWMNETGLHE